MHALMSERARKAFQHLSQDEIRLLLRSAEIVPKAETRARRMRSIYNPFTIDFWLAPLMSRFSSVTLTTGIVLIAWGRYWLGGGLLFGYFVIGPFLAYWYEKRSGNG